VGPGLPGVHVDSQAMEGSVLGMPCGHVGFRGMAGAVVPRLTCGVFVPGSLQDLWAQGCWAAMLVSGA